MVTRITLRADACAAALLVLLALWLAVFDRASSGVPHPASYLQCRDGSVPFRKGAAASVAAVERSGAGGGDASRDEGGPRSGGDEGAATGANATTRADKEPEVDVVVRTDEAPPTDDDELLPLIFKPWPPSAAPTEILTSAATASDSSNNKSSSSAAFAWEMLGELTTVLDRFFNASLAFSSHAAYSLLRARVDRELAMRRRIAVGERHRVPCFEFVRAEEAAAEVIHRVPCVAWDTQDLHSVAVQTFGLLARFHHLSPPTALKAAPAGMALPRPEDGEGQAPGPLRVAVEMSGHMRTYKRCAASLVDRLLAPNHALLFIATYPDLGDKRYGIRVQERDDEVSVRELRALYGAHLAAAYLCDLPTVTRRLNALFPHHFPLTQWSWMIYQLFMMELAHNVSIASAAGGSSGVEGSSGSSAGVELVSARALRGEGPSEAPWPDFDIVVRVRPDLYILGDVVVRAMSPTRAAFIFACGGNTFVDNFTTSDIIRAPHHPVYEWFSDPISDHSAVGFTSELTRFMHLFSSAKNVSPSEQGWKYFFHGNTAERMWTQHVQAQRLNVIRTVGWHIMLRNPMKFRNSTVRIANSARRAQLTEKVFGVTDPSEVECPRADRSMIRLGKKPSAPSGGRRGGRGGRR